jgi:hypothetical protein
LTGIRTHKNLIRIILVLYLDLPAGEYSGVVGKSQNGLKHGWRILLTAGAPMIDLRHGCIHRLDSIDQEMDEMSAWDPVPYARGKQHGRITVDVDGFCHIKLHGRN